MPYSSYNAYIAQSNGAVVLAIVVVNYLFKNFHVPLISSLLNSFIVKCFEVALAALCCYNVWFASSEVVNPYLSTVRIPYSDYLLTPGPLVSAFCRVYRFIFNELVLHKKSPVPSPAKANDAKPVTTNSTELPDFRQLLPKFLTNVSLLNNNNSQNQATTGNIPSSGSTSTLINNTYSLPPQERTNSSSSIFLNNTSISPQVASGINLTAYTAQPTINATLTASVIPKLRYTPCIKPPLRPTAHRERILWYLSPTPEVVDDFRIEQILGFQKNWHRFNDRLSRIYYDRMTNVLLKEIFAPLSKSIDSFNAILATKGQSLAKCPASTIALSLLIPGFNSNSVFTISEVVNFLTLEGNASEEGIQYVIERVKELASSNKMAAYRFTPKKHGMPTDSQIIMHIFKYYLSLKEPYVIPPLVPEEGDLFKFLLIYIYLTPELEHWKIFDIKL